MLEPEEFSEILKGLDDEIEPKADSYAIVINELTASENETKKRNRPTICSYGNIKNNKKRMKESLRTACS